MKSKTRNDLKRIIAFTLALILGISTLGMNTFASEYIIGDKADAYDIEVQKGSDFEIETNFENINYDKDKEKIELKEAVGSNENTFDINYADIYTTTYTVILIETHQSYEISRNIIVTEKENDTVSEQSNHDLTEEESEEPEETEAEPEELQQEDIFTFQNTLANIMPLANESSLVIKDSKDGSDQWEIPVLSYIYSSEINAKVYNYVKYVDNDAANGWRLAFCLQLRNHFVDSTQYISKEWQENSMYSELAYAIAHGSNKYGDTNDLEFSTGDWLKDYYITQTVIYCILFDYGYDGHSVGSLSAVSGYQDVYDYSIKMYNAVKANCDSSDGYGDTAYYNIIAPTSTELKLNDSGEYYQTDWYTIESKGEVSTKTISLSGAPGGTEIVYENGGNNSSFYIRFPVEQADKLNVESIDFKVKSSVNFSRPYTYFYQPILTDAQAVTFLEHKTTTDAYTSEADAVLKVEKAKIEIIKKGEETGKGLAGAVFGIYKDKACTDLLFKLTTASGGKTESSFVKTQDTLYIKEITAPANYLISISVYSVSVSCGQTSTTTITNTQVRGNIYINKIDVETQNFISQADANLIGAKYGLYAENDIYHPDNVTGILYKKGELIQEAVINSDGTCNFKDLYLGNYYIQEVQNPTGYLLDKTKYFVSLSYEDQTVKVVEKNIIVKEQVEKQAFQLIKISEDGEQTKTELIEGAGFTVYLISRLSRVKDGTLSPLNGSEYTDGDFIGYDFSKEEPAIIYENGKAVSVPELFTDDSGYIKSPELPYGKYIVVETTTPENLQTVNPFVVTITKDSREPQQWTVLDDRPFQFRFKIVKKDAQTGQTVINNSAKYKIYNMDTGEYVEQYTYYPNFQKITIFETNEEGYLITPQELGSGKYRIEEVEAPDGMVKAGYEMSLNNDSNILSLWEITTEGTYISAPKSITVINVSANTVHEIEAGANKNIVVVEQYNDEQVGSLMLKKNGEQLAEVKKGNTGFFDWISNHIKEMISQFTNVETDSIVYEFVYQDTGVQGAEFEIYAKDIIYTTDGQTDADGSRVVRYQKEELVTVLKTDENGEAVLNNLPIGSYYMKEVAAGKNFILNAEIKEFTLAYAGDETAVIYDTVEYYNERQKIEIHIQKVDMETDKPLEGVTFGLYSQEDIFTKNGELLLAKDSLIETKTTDENGKITFASDLPHARYYVKEEIKLDGYLHNEEIWFIDASYSNQEAEVLTFILDVENQPTITKIKKTDIESGEEIEGAILQIIKDEEILYEWITTEEEQTFYALPEGEYILYEKSAPIGDGYVKAEDITFTVLEDGNITYVEMKDDFSKAEISKTDLTTGKEIVGATMQIIDQDGIILEEWVSDGEPHFVTKLPVGETLILREISAPFGFAVAEDISFTLEETSIVQKIEMKDDYVYGQLTILKTDQETGQALVGAKFEIRNKTTGEVVETLVTDKAGRAVSNKLPLGVYTAEGLEEVFEYICVETEAPKGYELDQTEHRIVFDLESVSSSIVELVLEITNQAIPEISLPKTGDDFNITFLLTLAVVSSFGLAGVFYYKRRKARVSKI